MKAWRILSLAACLALAGCAANGSKNAEMAPQPKTLRASGYSTFDNSGRLSVNQRWLQAQQAAKLEAFRSLADQLYREPLDDGDTVGAKVMRDETYRIYLDTYLRGAAASDYRTVKDSLKATLELQLSPRFYRCMSGSAGNVDQCLQQENKVPFTRLGYKEATVTSANLACGSRDCNDLYYVSGFSKQPNILDDVLLDAGLYDAQGIVNTGARGFLQYFLFNGFFNSL
ncbi:hypothetical protein NP603_15205 [Methylomonas sp. SURF-1]|uniref:Lipoprotein n=1 Tax=Methylomonas aurea TaxID=2952224 RepID=A0ABT1UJQ7_9GAMM|nr:hypothetical protein [Methylomonas sp. SURF-1]MCQ8182468.1 hypothetical protein [Methylomonas sp. SURF-1]